MKVCFTLPEVAKRITHPLRAFVVVNGAVPEMAPAGILSVFGIVNAGLVGFSETTVGVEAGTTSKTTQLPEMPGVRTAGAQDSDQGLVTAGGTREMAAVKFAAPRAAEMTATCEVEMAPVEAVKDAATALEGTVKVPGTARRDGRLLERETDTPPTGAGLERVTVHAVLALELRLAAAHFRPERVAGAAGATRESVTGADEPFSVAVMVAGWSATSVPAAAVKAAEMVLAGTLTDDGTIKREGALLESATTAVLLTSFERVTVQPVLTLEVRRPAEH